MRKKIALAPLILIIILAFLLIFFPYLPPKSEIEKRVEEFYELANPGADAEVVSMEEESGVYKVVVKLTTQAGVTYGEAYITKDGRMLTETMIFVEESIKRINSFKNFTECLLNNNVRIYGISNDTATLLQLNLLGRYSTQIFIPCDGNLIINCLNANVSQIPSVVINGNVHPGVKTVRWFEQNTNCRMV